MKYQLGALAACAVVALAVPAAAQTAAPGARLVAHLDVSGQGSVDRLPDQAVVTFSVVASDDDATRATSVANATYNALVARLHGLGLDASAIKTSSYNVNFNPRPQQPNAQSQGPFGFIVTREVAVTSGKVDQVGAIVDAGVSAGVRDVNNVGFAVRDYRGAYRAALAVAVADAGAQARALAAAAHLRIVRILSIGNTQLPTRPMTSYVLAGQAAKSLAVPTEVQPSDLSIAATVNVTYEVAPLP
jgi:hypothetical protein